MKNILETKSLNNFVIVLNQPVSFTLKGKFRTYILIHNIKHGMPIP